MFEKRVSRRDFLKGAASILAGSAAMSILSACAPPTPAPTPTPAPAGAVPRFEGAKLVFWGHATHPQDSIKEAFQKIHPEVEYVWEHSGDWFTKLQAAMAAGEGTPDLVWTEAGANQDFGCRDLLLDLTEHITPIKDEFLPHKLEECFIAKTGKYVSIPSDAGNMMAWYYRPDLLEKAGWKEEIPDDWTYDTFFEITAMVKENLGGYTFCFPKSGWSALWAMTLNQLGGSLYDNTGTKMTGTNEIGVDAMRLVKKLWDSGGGLDVDWWSPPYWAAIKAGQLVGDFAAGWARGFIEAEVKTPEEGLGKWRLALLPKAPNGVSQTAVWGGANLSSPKFTKVPDLVWEYMKFAHASMEGSAILDDWGTTPAWIPYRKTPQFLERTVKLFGEWRFNQLWEKAAATINTKYYRKAGYDSLMGVVNTEMMPMIRGEVSIEEGMKELEKKLQAEHERLGCF